MRQPPKPSQFKASGARSLSEISHLFLTDLRDRTSESAARPARKPPAAKVTDEGVTRAKLSLVVGSHLGVSALKSVRRYAAHLAREYGRVGLIELSDDGLRLSCFDSTSAAASGGDSPMEPVDGKRIAQAIAELTWDIERWLLFLPAGEKSDHARKLIAEAGHWTLLVTAEDDGLVAGYRALKGISQLGSAEISAAILDADDDAQATIVHRKLSGAGRQFLNRPVESEGRVRQADGVAEHVVLFCRAAGTAQDHWAAVADLVSKSQSPEIPADEASEPIPLNPTTMPTPTDTVASTPRISQVADVQDILDVSSASDGPAILAAIVSRQTDYVGSSIAAPACPQSRVAVDREGRLTLLALADGGLPELRAIGEAYRWLNENRALIRLALPQMNIDAGAMPRLTLFADQSCAANLTPIFQGNVTIQTYRRIRWGEKTGLLLEAA
jgi:hypothetical protein